MIGLHEGMLVLSCTGGAPWICTFPFSGRRDQVLPRSLGSVFLQHDSLHTCLAREAHKSDV